MKTLNLDVGFFKNRKIVNILQMPEGDSLVNIWLHLLCLAAEVDDNGRIYLSELVSYTPGQLAKNMNRRPHEIDAALRLFERLKMISREDEKIQILNWGKYQSESPMTERQREMFDGFLSEYPVKTNVSNARKEFSKLSPDEDLYRKIMAGVEEVKNKVRLEGTRFVVNPARYLGERRWEDVLSVSPLKKTGARYVSRIREEDLKKSAEEDLRIIDNELRGEQYGEYNS